MDLQTQINIFIWLGFATMVCLAFAVLLFFNTHRKKVLEKEAKMQIREKEQQFEIFKSASSAAEKEKEKIGRNMHDHLIPVLSALERSLGTNINDFSTPAFEIDRMHRDYKLVGDLIENIKGISYDLVPKTLQTLGLVEAIKEYAQLLHKIDNNEIVFENNFPKDFVFPFSTDDLLVIYRATLELINNIIKHAKPRVGTQQQAFYLKIIIENDEDKLIVALMHNGNGISNHEINLKEKEGTGVGLRSLRSRALILHSEIDYSIRPDFAIITFTIPLNR